MDYAVCLHNATLLTGFSIMENCAVYIKRDKIADVYNETHFKRKNFGKNVELIDVKGAFIAPGFIDTHIHGIGGYSTEDEDYHSILKMSEILPRYGVTSFIPTIGAAPEKHLMARIKAVLSAMGKEKGAQILGIHLEGPFLSAEKIGGQDIDGISPIDLNYLKRIIKAGHGHIINMTVAPELAGIRELAFICTEHNIVLQAGHTNATYGEMMEGVQAGIFHATHMFNAMRPLHHREPGTVGAILTHPELSCEFIADGFHVHPHLFHLLAKCKPISRLVMITDSLKYTKAEIPQEIDLYFDQCFRRKSDGTIMGSGITMLDGFQNLLKIGIPLDKAVLTASCNPAQIMKQPAKGAILPQRDADLIVLDKDFQLKMTIIKGKICK